MRRALRSRRDPRLFRGDVVETLNVLRREGAILDFELPPRERGVIEVPRIAVHVRAEADTEASLAAVRAALQAIPLFADLGGEIELDGRP
jgi:hypothetical protein